MITDCHTHFWYDAALSSPWTDDLVRIPGMQRQPPVTLDSYRRGTAPAERTIVFGIRARAAGIAVPNDAVADFVATAGPSAVGFLSVDPTEHGALEEIDRSVDELGLVGVKLGLPYQAVAPGDPRTMRVFAHAERRGLPVIVHQGAIFTRAGRMTEANPILLDDVALAFPELRLVVAHVGHPWMRETAVVMRRHANVYADVSAISRRPTVMLDALIAAQEYGVFDKLLFGSDFPMLDAQTTADTLRRVAAHSRSHTLTPIGDDMIDGILHRDTFALLGIPEPAIAHR